MGKVVSGNRIGASKEDNLLGIYTKLQSDYSLQDGNAPLGGATVVGGFSDNTYTEKYAGGDGEYGRGAGIGHSNLEMLDRVLEKPAPPVYRG